MLSSPSLPLESFGMRKGRQADHPRQLSETSAVYFQQNKVTRDKDHTMAACHKCFKTCVNERLWYMYLWSGGLSFRSIAKMTGRSPTTVRKWVVRLLNENLQSVYGAGGQVWVEPCRVSAAAYGC